MSEPSPPVRLADDKNGGPLRRRSAPVKAAFVVVQRVMSDIAAGQLRPGDGLLPEKEMLDDYGVGRGTLREALRFLELQGIISLKSGPGGGPIVAAPDSRHLANALGLLLQISETRFGAVIEARQLIEPQLAALAAERADEALLEQLHESVERMRVGRNDADLFLRENQRFHQLVASAAGNPVFALLMDSLHWIIDGSRQGVQYPERYRGIVVRAHERVLAAIEAHDADAARTEMYDHIENMLIYLRKHYPTTLEQPMRWELVQS
jgi:GntR family transcriptional repressor for pyruvate dehydrogenase complex